MKKTSLALKRETVRSLAADKLSNVAGGISRPRNCNFSQNCGSFHCDGSDMVYGCAGGPETDTSAYSAPCQP
jgi:hypothetical protein